VDQCTWDDTWECGTSCWLGGNCPTNNVDRQYCWDGTARDYRFLVWFRPDPSRTCPSGLFKGDLSLASARVRYTVSRSEKWARTFQEKTRCCYPYNGLGCEDDPETYCAQYPDRCVTGTAPGRLTGWNVEETGYFNLAMVTSADTDLAFVIDVWNQYAEGVLSPPWDPPCDDEFAVAYGRIEKAGGSGSYQSSGMCNVPYQQFCDCTDWETEESSYSFLGYSNYSIALTDVHVEVDSGDALGWRDTLIWTGNDMGNPQFSQIWYDAHVFQLP